MGSAEGLARGREKSSFERFLWRERNRMEHQIQTRRVPAHLFEKSIDLLVASNIAGIKRSIGTKLAHQVLDVFFQTLALVIENQTGSSAGPGFRNRPGDAPFVRDSEDDAVFTRENFFCHNRSTLPGLPTMKRLRTTVQGQTNFPFPLPLLGLIVS